MSEFDEWYFKQRYLGIEPIDHARAAFEAGQQSQQAKIDLLEVQLKGAEERAKLTLDHKNKMVDELQARVDGIEKWIELNKRTIALEYSGYTTEEYVDADDLLDILKGNQDEN